MVLPALWVGQGSRRFLQIFCLDTPVHAECPLLERLIRLEGSSLTFGEASRVLDGPRSGFHRSGKWMAAMQVHMFAWPHYFLVREVLPSSARSFQSFAFSGQPLLVFKVSTVLCPVACWVLCPVFVFEVCGLLCRGERIHRFCQWRIR